MGLSSSVSVLEFLLWLAGIFWRDLLSRILSLDLADSFSETSWRILGGFLADSISGWIRLLASGMFLLCVSTVDP
jgi:hypothetical protein